MTSKQSIASVKSRDLLAQPAFAELDGGEVYPGDRLSGDDDEDAVRWIAERGQTGLHPTSTCRMGPGAYGDHPSVVDTKLRVYGVQGLRVCDASVFPEIITAHTMAPVVMVAERCAEFLKEATA